MALKSLMRGLEHLQCGGCFLFYPRVRRSGDRTVRVAVVKRSSLASQAIEMGCLVNQNPGHDFTGVGDGVESTWKKLMKQVQVEIITMKTLLRIVMTMSAVATTTYAAGAEPLTIRGDKYPRVFYFRATESACSPRAYPTYESWERNFDGLMGIMGKCLEEECLGRMPRAPQFFTKFKQRHPNQAVLLHFNGNSRDPLFERENYFPGHWVYRKAVTITEDVPATAGESVIYVSDASGFRVNAGRYQTHSDDISLFGTKDGKHDWYCCEHVQLVSVDIRAKTITVKRGCYGSKPLAFEKGKSRAAAHQVEGPWGANNHFLWYYNYSTHCPRDKNGKTCSDLLVDDLAGWFGKGGVLEAYDGIEFDVHFNQTHGDTTGDGMLDNGVVDGKNNYGIGVVEFGRKLRARMGEDFIIQADGALGKGGVRSQRCWGLFNGIESEGWPNLPDWEIEDWSGGMNRHRFWQQNARTPAFNYINHKWVQGIPDRPGFHRQVDVPFSRHRLVFAAGQFFDAMICYSSVPKLPKSTGYTYWHRDVTLPPNARLLFSIGMGAKSPERSDGVWFKVLVAEVTAGQADEYEQIFEKSSNEFKWLPQAVSLEKYAGKTMRLTFVADCGPSDNATTDQAYWGDVRIESDGDAQRLVTRKLPAMGMRLRNREEQPIIPKTGARLSYSGAAEIGGQPLPAYTVHPPYQRQGAFEKFPIWDEFVCGQDNVLGWLGSPEAPAVHMAEKTPDLFRGTGRGPALAKQVTGRVVASAGETGVTIRSKDANAKTLKFAIKDVPANGEDLFVSLTMKGSPMTGYPREMARFAQVSASGGMINLLAGEPDETGMCLRGGKEVPVDKSTGAQVQNHQRTIGGTTLPTVFVHPPYRGRVGYAYWIKGTEVLPNTELRFSIGMGEKSPERSDGVWFKVYAAQVKDGIVGPYAQIFETSSKAHQWIPHRVPLAEYAGQQVRLKFVADCGPANNSVTDHAHWGDVKIITTGASESDVTKAVQYMTWVNDRSFASTFYYRHVKTKQVDLSFTIESPEPVVIESIRAHAHPDAMYRVFEKGLVLANPARRPYTFDLNSIAPGRSYRRLKATKFQDNVTNNGEPVSDKVTLGERDALFLLQIMAK